ncbi:hypothetical protein ACFW04_003111 [Cataglyphis niger]
MNDKDDSAWVFDSLIGFLQGPIWSSPLLTFIEEKSLVFEANTEDCEEYRKIYQEYKNLVDLLLGCFMEDMNISPEQFEYACTVNKDTKIPIQFQQMNPEDIKKRQDYLKARRDKLVALKKEARSQQLEMNKNRPSSARVVAEATMKGQQELEAAQTLDPSILQVRRALAARLKAEVVHK